MYCRSGHRFCYYSRHQTGTYICSIGFLLFAVFSLKMNGWTYASPLIWSFVTDSGMAAPVLPDEATDPEDLKMDLMYEIIGLNRELTGLGYSMNHIPAFLQRTEALEATDALIQKLRKQLDFMRKLKDKWSPSNSNTALFSASAPSACARISASAPSADVLLGCAAAARPGNCNLPEDAPISAWAQRVGRGHPPTECDESALHFTRMKRRR